MSVKEVAEYFSVSTRTIRAWLERDETFPRAFKKFGTLRFQREDVEAYWAKNTRADRNNR